MAKWSMRTKILARAKRRRSAQVEDTAERLDKLAAQLALLGAMIEEAERKPAAEKPH